MTGYFAGLAARVHLGASEEQPALIRPRLPSLYESAGDHLQPSELSADSSDVLTPPEEEPTAPTEQSEQGFDIRQAVRLVQQPLPTIQPSSSRQSAAHESFRSPAVDALVQPDHESPNISPIRQPGIPVGSSLPMPDRHPNPTIRAEVAWEAIQPTVDREGSPDNITARAEPAEWQSTMSPERLGIVPDSDHPVPQTHARQGQFQLEGAALVPRQTAVNPAEALPDRLAVPNDTQSDPVVHVSIGRIEIRSPAAPELPAPAQRPTARPAPVRRPARTLDDYLERRNGGDL